MKKTILFTVMFMLVAAGAFAAAKKPAEKPDMLVFADVGLAVSDFEGLFVDAGLQYGFTPKLFAEALFEYYFGPAGSGIDSSAWGLNLNGVYKHELSDGLKLFGKAGICLIHTSVYSFGNSDIGFNAGGGVEYALNEKMGLRGGTTVKMSFADGDTATFFKLYAGFYRSL